MSEEDLALIIADAVANTPASWTQEKWKEDYEPGPNQTLSEVLEGTYLCGDREEIIMDAARIAAKAALKALGETK